MNTIDSPDRWLLATIQISQVIENKYFSIYREIQTNNMDRALQIFKNPMARYNIN